MLAPGQEVRGSPELLAGGSRSCRVSSIRPRTGSSLQRDGAGVRASLGHGSRKLFLLTERTRFQPGKLRVWGDVKGTPWAPSCF